MSKPTQYWTRQRVEQFAKLCECRSEFFRRFNCAYHAASRKGWLGDVCSHMSAAPRNSLNGRGYWTKEKVLQTAKKFNKRSEFCVSEPSAYQKARRKGWLDEACSHMESAEHPSGYWTKKRVQVYALKCEARIEFEKKYKNAYAAAQRHGWLADVCAHMPRLGSPQNYWTIERVQAEANKYGTRTEFYIGNKNAYAAAHRNHWLDDACAHMSRVGNLLRRCIYVIFSRSSNKAYVGLTFNFEKRMAAHFAGLNKPTKELVNSVDITKQQLTDYLRSEDARRLELKYYNEYKRAGFEMLNCVSSIGGLGGGNSKWDFDSLYLVARKYKRRQDFRNDESRAYNVARENGWLDDICGHMYSGKKPHGFWTKERVNNEALKYGTRSEFCKKAPAAASKARKSGWMEDVCKHMVFRPSYIKWTYERVQKEAIKYSNKKAFVENAPGAASAAYRNGWIKNVCKHMVPTPYPRKWTFDKVKEVALQYETRTDFANNSPAAVSAVKKSGWMNSVCQHMRSGRSSLRYWTFDRVKEEALKFKTKKDFRNKSASAASVAQKYGWNNDVCSHMVELRKKKGYWNLETLSKEALKYKTRTEFATKAKGAYTTAHRKGWLDVVCAHMNKATTVLMKSN